MSLESPHVTVDLTEQAWKRVKESRKVVEDILESGKLVYGINTGFGSFSNVSIDKTQLSELQVLNRGADVMLNVVL